MHNLLLNIWLFINKTKRVFSIYKSIYRLCYFIEKFS